MKRKRTLKRRQPTLKRRRMLKRSRQTLTPVKRRVTVTMDVWNVLGVPLRAMLTRQECALALGISLRTFDELRARHAHPAIQELLPRTGRFPKFSGQAVQRWRDGKALVPVSRFGRKTA